MAFTPVPTVTDGDDLLDDWGKAVAAAATEVQAFQRLSATGTALTTSGTTKATVATIVVPPPPVAGSLLVFCKMYRSQTVATDTFDVHLEAGGVPFSINRQAGPVDASFQGMVALAAGVGVTLTTAILRQVGTGTASVVSDGRFNRIDALFIPAP